MAYTFFLQENELNTSYGNKGEGQSDFFALSGCYKYLSRLANLGNGTTYAYIIRQLSSNSFLLQDVYDSAMQLPCTLTDNYGIPNVGDMYIGMMWYNADGGEGYYQAVAELNDNTVISFNSGYITGGGDGGEGYAFQQADGTWDVNMPWLLGTVYDTNLAQGWASIWTNTYFWDI